MGLPIPNKTLYLLCFPGRPTYLECYDDRCDSLKPNDIPCWGIFHCKWGFNYKRFVRHRTLPHQNSLIRRQKYPLNHLELMVSKSASGKMESCNDSRIVGNGWTLKILWWDEGGKTKLPCIETCHDVVLKENHAQRNEWSFIQYWCSPVTPYGDKNVRKVQIQVRRAGETNTCLLPIT